MQGLISPSPKERKVVAPTIGKLHRMRPDASRINSPIRQFHPAFGFRANATTFPSVGFALWTPRTLTPTRHLKLYCDVRHMGAA